MRLLRHDNDPYPCGNMKSARPQILLQEDVVQNGPTAPPDVVEDDDLTEYARALGINAKNDPDLLWIAREGLQAALPPDWRALEDQPSGQIYYFNVENGQAAWEHPMDGHYRQVVEQERQKRLRKTCIEDPALIAADVDGSPGRPKSPYASVFRQPSPNSPFGPRFERPTLRPRGFLPPASSRSPTGNNLATPPPWAKPALNRQPTPSPTRTPSASPVESRKSSVNSDGLVMKSPDSSSVPFNRTSSPNATSADHTLIDGVKPSGAQPPRASGSFQDEKPPIMDRKLSVDKKLTPTPPPSLPVVPVPVVPSVQPISLEVLKEEEMRIKTENDLALQKIREQLAKEKLEEEAKIRAKMTEDLRVMREKMAKEKELSEKDLRQKAADELKKVKDLVQKERESQERSIRDHVHADLRKLKEQLEVERTTQERTLRGAITEKLKETEAQEAARKAEQAKEDEAQLKELEELRRSMEKEISELQATHKRRVDDLRMSHETELQEIERNLVKLRRELEKLEMQVADESAIKKTQIEALERQKASLEKHLSDLRQQELDIRAQCGNLTDELNQLTKDSKLNERAMSRLEQQRTDMEEDLYMLKRAKQRYVDRVEQLKLVVGESLLPLPSDLDEVSDAKNSNPPNENADSAAVETPGQSGTPVIEVASPLLNGLLPQSPERAIDSDDLLSNPSRPLTPEPTSSRAASPASFFRRHSSRSGDPSAGTTNGLNIKVASTNQPVFNLPDVPSTFHDLLMNETVCSDVALSALMSSLVFPVSLSVQADASRLDHSVRRHYNVSPPTGCTSNHHPSPCAPDSALSAARTATTRRPVSCCPSPDCGPAKIANTTRPLSDLLSPPNFSDPNAYMLQHQLAAIKDWIARQNAKKCDGRQVDSMASPPVDASLNCGYNWIPDSSMLNLSDIS